MSLRFTRIAIALAASMALGTTACAQTMQQLSTDITELVRDAVPSVVSIVATRTVPGASDEEAGRVLRSIFRATGTGFVVEPGYVLTTDTVAANATELEVTFPVGGVVKGTLVGRDAMTNTALIKVNKTGTKPLVLGDSSTIGPGALVVSVSNRGSADNRVTLGIVSSVGARMAGLDTPVLQISGDIGPGASGGPIFDSDGKVVGMTVAMQAKGLDLLRASKDALKDAETPRAPKLATPKGRVEVVAPRISVSESGKRFVLGTSGQSDSVSGNTGYAVPSNTIKAVLESLKSGKEIVRGYLGLLIDDKDGKIVVRGTEPDSPAAKGGVKAGDMLASANDKVFSGSNQFRDYVSSLKPGETLKLKVGREGKEVELAVTVGKRPPGAAVDMGQAVREAQKQMRALTDQIEKSGSPSWAMPDLAVPHSLWTGRFPQASAGGLNLDDAGIAEVGKALMDAYKANVIVSNPSKITGKVSIHLNPKTITLDKALTSICHAMGCEYKKDGETYIISAK